MLRLACLSHECMLTWHDVCARRTKAGQLVRGAAQSLPRPCASQLRTCSLLWLHLLSHEKMHMASDKSTLICMLGSLCSPMPVSNFVWIQPEQLVVACASMWTDLSTVIWIYESVLIHMWPGIQPENPVIYLVNIQVLALTCPNKTCNIATYYPNKTKK